jgi:hypothetical protein
MMAGGSVRACCRVVSLTSRLWVLAFRHRREYTTHQPAIPGSVRRCCRKPFLITPKIFLTHSHHYRLTQTAPSPLAKSTLVPSVPIRPRTPHPPPQLRSINPFRSTRLKISEFMRISIINSTSTCSRANWIKSCLGCYGISIG